jgi:RNA polymerase sigma factor (sigma-70 family)
VTGFAENCLESVLAPGKLPAVGSPQSKLDQWFSAEVQPHEPSLRTYLHASFPSVRGDIDDVVQTSYLRIWHKRAAEPIQSAKAFLFAIARHIAVDLIRRERRSPLETVGVLATLDVIDDSQVSVSETVSRAERIRLLIEAIDALPPRCREVMILRKLKFVSQREVAARLGISESGVEIQLTRGLARCREFLRRHGVSSFFGHEA